MYQKRESGLPDDLATNTHFISHLEVTMNWKDDFD